MTFDQVRSISLEGAAAVLKTISDVIGGSVRSRKQELNDGSILTHVLYGTYREHKLELRANEQIIVADVEARYGQFHLLIFNERPWKSRYGKPAALVGANGIEHAMYTIRGELSEDHTKLLQSGALSRLLSLIDPQEFEQVDVSQQLVRIRLQHPSTERVFSVLDAVVDQMPHESQKHGSPDSDTLPAPLQPLVPFLAKWAIDDDEERTRKLRRSAASTRQKLIDAVIPRLSDIDAFLSSLGANPPTDACAFGSLAQAALEAQLVQAPAKKQRSL